MTIKNLLVLAGAVLALGAVAVAAGCGGGSDTAEASLTKQQFIKRADAICLKTQNQQLQIAVDYAGDHPGATEDDVAVSALVEPLQKEIPKLKALGESMKGDEEVQNFLALREKGLEEAEADPTLITAPLENNPFEEANKAGKKYGLKTCAKAP